MAKRQAEFATHFQTEMDNLRAEHAMEIKNMKVAVSEVSSIGGKVGAHPYRLPGQPQPQSCSMLSLC